MLIYVSVALALFLVAVMFTGAAAYFAKTFLHIQPSWMFGLFD